MLLKYFGNTKLQSAEHRHIKIVADEVEWTTK